MPHRRIGHALVVAALLLVVDGAPGVAKAEPGCRYFEGDRSGPCLTLTPSSGPVGTRVTFTGHVPQDTFDMWAEQWSDHPSRGLAGHFSKSAEFAIDCELLVSAEPMHLDLNRQTGEVSGSFTVGSTGTCKQSAGTPEEDVRHATPPGRYGLFDGAMASFIASFTVTDGATALPFTGVRQHPFHTLGLGVVLIMLGSALLRAGRRRVSCV